MQTIYIQFEQQAAIYTIVQQETSSQQQAQYRIELQYSCKLQYQSQNNMKARAMWSGLQKFVNCNAQCKKMQSKSVTQHEIKHKYNILYYL